MGHQQAHGKLGPGGGCAGRHVQASYWLPWVALAYGSGFHMWAAPEWWMILALGGRGSGTEGHIKAHLSYRRQTFYIWVDQKVSAAIAMLVGRLWGSKSGFPTCFGASVHTYVWVQLSAPQPWEDRHGVHLEALLTVLILGAPPVYWIRTWGDGPRKQKDSNTLQVFLRQDLALDG